MNGNTLARRHTGEKRWQASISTDAIHLKILGAQHQNSTQPQSIHAQQNVVLFLAMLLVWAKDNKAQQLATTQTLR